MKGKAVMMKPKKQVHFWIQTIQKVTPSTVYAVEVIDLY